MHRDNEREICRACGGSGYDHQDDEYGNRVVCRMCRGSGFER